MVICLERGADLQHLAQLMPLPLTVSCFSKIQIGFIFLVLAHPGSPGQRAIKRVCVCVCVCVCVIFILELLVILWLCVPHSLSTICVFLCANYCRSRPTYLLQRLVVLKQWPVKWLFHSLVDCLLTQE